MANLKPIQVLKRAGNMVLGLWRPMIAYILMIWAFQFVILAPPCSWILSQLSALPGDVIVGNYTIAHWIFSFKGLLFLLLFGPFVLMGIYIQAIGAFLIANEFNKGKIVTAKEIVSRVFLIFPKLIQYCLFIFSTYVLFFVIVGIGPAFAKLILLNTYDINYY